MTVHTQVNTSRFPFLQHPVKIGEQEWDQDTMPLVSVSCLAYNHEGVIKKALEGFLMQETTFRVEVLIHDDASTDDTATIIREYESRYPSIFKVIYQTENQYSQKIKIGNNYQYPRVKGKYYATCEGDDYWTDPLKLQKQFDLMEAAPEIGACFTNALYINELEGTSSAYVTDLKEGLVSVEKVIEKGGSIYPTATLMYRRELIGASLSEVIPELAGDEALIFSIAHNSQIYFIDQSTAVYRRWSGGVYSSISKDTEKLVQHKKRNIIGYQKFNRHTDYKYNRLIKAKIAKNSIYIIQNSQDWSTKLSYFKHLSFRQKVAFLIR